MVSKVVDKVIQEAIDSYGGDFELGNPFEELLSMGELIDRLSIVNFKLYTLKDNVMVSMDESFKAWAAVEDVKLVRERARLKRTIDEKLSAMIERTIQTGSTGFNPEVKKYGV